MSEQTGNSESLPPFKPGDTQPLKPVGKKGRLRSILVGILAILVLLLLAGLGGYASGIGERTAAQSHVISQQLTEQFQFALVDEQFGRYEAARERLEFIIQNNPSFPGAQNELAKVLVRLAIPTATRTPPPTSTPDLRGEQSLFATAQQLTASGDWVNALAALDQLRKQDRNFNTSQIDGMYYFALRNYGVSLIQKDGNLEGGIYQLTLAERFAPLDNTANQLREGARAYIQAASFYGVDWSKTVALFSQVAPGWPSLWDGSMSASQRYQFALMRYGDQLFAEGRACDALEQYQTAESIGQLDFTAAKGRNQANQVCNPPTEAPPETPVPGRPTPTP